MPDYNIFNYWCNAKLVVWHRGLVGFFINKSAFGAKGPRIKSPWRQTVKSMFYISSNKVWLNQNLTPWYTLKSNLDSSPKSRACPRATQQDCAKCGGTPLLSRSWHRKIFRRKADKKKFYRCSSSNMSIVYFLNMWQIWMSILLSCLSSIDIE